MLNMDDIQLFVTFLVLLVAVNYAAWRIYMVLKCRKTGCDGCELKKNCQKFGSYK